MKGSSVACWGRYESNARMTFCGGRMEEEGLETEGTGMGEPICARMALSLWPPLRDLRMLFIGE